MKVVIIANTIFPHNQPRSFRGTELAKEFSRLGHDVHLYGVLGKYDYNSFEKKYGLKVHNIGRMRYFPINSDDIEPHYTLWRKILGKVGGKIIAFPEIEFLPKLKHILQKQQKVDLLITLAPSHAIHWGTALAKNTLSDFPKVWIADCGDPFMGRKIYPFYFRYLENFTFKKSDWITIPIEEARNAYNKDIHNKIRIIPQGFNFEEVNLPNIKVNNSIPTFIYAGVFYKGIRDPIHFIEYISKLKTPYLFRLFTRTNSIVKNYKGILGSRLEVNCIIPRAKLLEEMNKADFLMNFNNTSNIQSPSKLIDYAIVNRPILNIEQHYFDEQIVNDFLNGNYVNRYKVMNIDQYRIQNVAQKFLNLYEQTIHKKYI